MDNITHTLIGVALGRSAPARDLPERRAAFWTAVTASNFPDLDFLVTAATGGGKLGYLLQHRGHTHTLLLAAPAGALLALLFGRLFKVPRARLLSLIVLGIVAAFLHIGADSWNEYGVHPFWPLDSRWYYGDFIFIMEPLLWFSLLPLAIQSASSKRTRWSWIGVGGLMFAAVWGLPFLPWSATLWVTAWAALFLFAQHRLRGVAVAWTGFFATLLIFFTTSGMVRSQVTRAFAFTPEDRLLQLVLSPSPGNPFCWRVIAVTEQKAQDRYSARLGAFSLLPSSFEPQRCALRLNVERTAPIVKVEGAPTNPGLYWEGEFQSHRGELTRLAQTNCRFEALLRFARVPFWTSNEEGLVAGDLRFDREPELGFSEIPLTPAEPCPRFLPPWEAMYE